VSAPEHISDPCSDYRQSKKKGRLLAQHHHPTPLTLALSPTGRGDNWESTAFFPPRPVGERVAEGRVRGLPVGRSPQLLCECTVVLGEKSRLTSSLDRTRHVALKVYVGKQNCQLGGLPLSAVRSQRSQRLLVSFAKPVKIGYL